MTGYSADTLDLSRLGAPSLVEAGYDAAKARQVAEFLRLWALARVLDPSLPAYDVQTLHTDPAIILIEEFAHAEALIRTAINDTANALRLATATGADLGHVAKTYHNTERLVLVPADPAASPPRPEVLEGDEELRERAALAPEAFPEFGLVPGGYAYRVRRKYGDRVRDVRALTLGGGRVDLVILGRGGDGTAPAELIGDIQAEFNGEGDFQSTDVVTVRSARIVPYAIALQLEVPPGPDPAPAEAAALKRLRKIADERHKLGGSLPGRQLDAAALGSPAVANDVRRFDPVADIPSAPDAAPYCTAINVLPSQVVR